MTPSDPVTRSSAGTATQNEPVSPRTTARPTARRRPRAGASSGARSSARRRSRPGSRRSSRARRPRRRPRRPRSRRCRGARAGTAAPRRSAHMTNPICTKDASIRRRRPGCRQPNWTPARALRATSPGRSAARDLARREAEVVHDDVGDREHGEQQTRSQDVRKRQVDLAEEPATDRPDEHAVPVTCCPRAKTLSSRPRVARWPPAHRRARPPSRPSRR